LNIAINITENSFLTSRTIFELLIQKARIHRQAFITSLPLEIKIRVDLFNKNNGEEA
jgi:hypothetical protein